MTENRTMSLDKNDMDVALQEQERYLPIANITRVMKKALPAESKISKEAKECVQECVTEFVQFVTSEASDRCQQEKRKTINGDDIIFALSTLGFDNYADCLKLYLTKYQDSALKTEKHTQQSKDMISPDIHGQSQQSSQQMSAYPVYHSFGVGSHQMSQSFPVMPPHSNM